MDKSPIGVNTFYVDPVTSVIEININHLQKRANSKGVVKFILQQLPQNPQGFSHKVVFDLKKHLKAG